MLGQNDPEPWQPKRALLELSVPYVTKLLHIFPISLIKYKEMRVTQYCTALLKT